MAAEGMHLQPAAATLPPATTVEIQSDDRPVTNHDTHNGIVQTLPPSHILEDGRFIYLPPPNAAERSRFFERSIARHGLLEKDMNPSDRKALADEKKEQQKEEKAKNSNNKSKKDKTEPKIHPLWIASARLDSGMNELNRAINLATLVNMNEFFTYTNVVDPRQVDDAAPVARASSTTTGNASSPALGSGASGDKSGSSVINKNVVTVSSAAAAAALAAEHEQEVSRQVESLFCMKRKRQQFEHASRQLKRHRKRLRAGVYAQRVLDQRLFQLRKRWKLVLPEHGTRARAHAPRTNELVAIDVDMYSSRADHNREHRNTRSYRRQVSLAGRMASRVPRLATIELKDDFNVLSYQDTVSREGNDAVIAVVKNPDHEKNDSDNQNDDNAEVDDDVAMEYKETPSKDPRGDEDAGDDQGNGPETDESDEQKSDLTNYTRAEPFAVADPNLGRVQENFDPSKIPMLNLQIEIHKSSTGFVQIARLEPTHESFSGVRSADKKRKKSSSATSCNNEVDEELLASLQHSLFCANLFESMRSELDTEDDMDDPHVFAVGRGRNTNKGLQNMAWLASESDENYIASPSFLVGDYDQGKGQSALSVIHCHDGELKVLLDAEYTLCIKLVEANADGSMTSHEVKTSSGSNRNSGSQPPEQLYVLCRALLLHAQEVQHVHSLAVQRMETQNEIRTKSVSPADRTGTANQPVLPPKPSILQSCVSLGCKILFERRVRTVLRNVNKWLQSTCGETMEIQWLPLSVFDLHSQFCIGFRNIALDVAIAGTAMVVSRIVNGTTYRKVRLWSEQEFEIFLKLEFNRAMRS